MLGPAKPYPLHWLFIHKKEKQHDINKHQKLHTWQIQRCFSSDIPGLKLLEADSWRSNKAKSQWPSFSTALITDEKLTALVSPATTWVNTNMTQLESECHLILVNGGQQNKAILILLNHRSMQLFEWSVFQYNVYIYTCVYVDRKCILCHFCLPLAGQRPVVETNILQCPT